MPNIIKKIPLSRTREQVIFDDGTQKVRCYSNSTPHYYKDNEGNFNEIDISNIITTESNIGNILLKNKSISSVGLRTDGESYKYLGFRPDECQDGSEQLEFSINKIIFNNEEQNILLNEPTSESNFVENLGITKIFSTRNGTRQLVSLPTNVNSFRIEYKINLQGLTINYDEQTDTYELKNSENKLRYRICRPLFTDANYNPLLDGNTAISKPAGYMINHSLINNGDGSYTYIKENNQFFDRNKLQDICYIDADTVYSTTKDGYVAYSHANWNTAHDALTGSSAVDTNGKDIASSFSIRTTLSGGIYYVSRGFFYFDTSGLQGILNVDFKLWGYNYDEPATNKIYVQKGTQANTLTTADYDSFSGTEYGHVTAFAHEAYNTFSFNATGISEIVNGTTKLCVRSVRDYDDTTPTAFDHNSGCAYADTTGTANDPYLEITTYYIASATAVDLTNPSSITCNKPTGTIDDDVMVAHVTIYDNLAVITPPAGWVEIFQKQESANTDRTTGVFYKIASSEGANYTFNLTNNPDVAISISTFRGVNTTHVLDVVWNDSNHRAIQTDSSSLPVPSLTSATDNAIIVVGGHCTHNQISTWIAPSSPAFTRRVNLSGASYNHVQQIVATRILESSDTISPSGIGATSNSTGDSTTWIIALRTGEAVIYPEDLDFTIVSSSTLSDITSYLDSLSTTIISSDSINDIQSYIDNLLNLLQTSDSINDIQSYIDNLSTGIIALTTINDIQSYINNLSTTIISSVDILDLLTLSEDLSVSINSVIEIEDVQSFVANLLLDIQSSVSMVDSLLFYEALNMQMQVTLDIDDSQTFKEDLDLISMFNFSLTDLKNYTDNLELILQTITEIEDNKYKNPKDTKGKIVLNIKFDHNIINLNLKRR